MLGDRPCRATAAALTAPALDGEGRAQADKSLQYPDARGGTDAGWIAAIGEMRGRTRTGRRRAGDMRVCGIGGRGGRVGLGGRGSGAPPEPGGAMATSRILDVLVTLLMPRVDALR